MRSRAQNFIMVDESRVLFDFVRHELLGGRGEFNSHQFSSSFDRDQTDGRTETVFCNERTARPTVKQTDGETQSLTEERAHVQSDRRTGRHTALLTDR